MPYSTSYNQHPARSKHTFIKVAFIIAIVVIALFLTQIVAVFLFGGQTIFSQAKSTIDVEVYLTPYYQDYAYEFTLSVNGIEKASGSVSYNNPANATLMVEFPSESSGGYSAEITLTLIGQENVPFSYSSQYLTLVNGERYSVTFAI